MQKLWQKNERQKGNASNKARAILKLRENDNPSHPGRVQQIINNTEGVVKVNINHLTNTLSIEYNPDKISLAEIKQSVAKARAEAQRTK